MGQCKVRKVTAALRYVQGHQGRGANPRPVATIKTGRVTMSLWLVARRDRSSLCRPVLDLPTMLN